jgi:hypothetical protein
MRALVCAAAGFLLAVLWFDLMFDVQARGRGDRAPGEQAIASIAAYYRRVTTTARPMNRLVACAMAAALAGIVVEVVHAGARGWVPWVSLGLAAAPIALAALHTVPGAVRLGARGDPPARQRQLARSILRDHVLCALSIAALLALQLSQSGP